MGSNITMALIFVMTLNCLLWLSQVAIIDLNPSGTEFFHCDGSMLNSFGECGANSNYINETQITNQLPSLEGSVSATTGNLFTDLFTATKGWLLNVPGINYMVGMVKAPYVILKSLNLPEAFVYTIGTLWYAITLFLLVAFILGRDV